MSCTHPACTRNELDNQSLLALPDGADLGTSLRQLAQEEVKILSDRLGLHASGQVRILGFGTEFSVIAATTRAMAYRMRDANQLLAILSRLCAAHLPHLVNSISTMTFPTSVVTLDDIRGRMSMITILQNCCPLYFRSYFWHPPTQVKIMEMVAGVMKLMVEMLGKIGLLADGQTVKYKGVKYTADRAPSVLGKLCGVAAALGTFLFYIPPETATKILASKASKDLLQSSKLLWQLNAFVPCAKGASDVLISVLHRGLQDKVPTPMKAMDEIRGLEGCGRRGCYKIVGDVPMFQCSRCNTVLYCCAAHQEDDWTDQKRPHKAWCYKTTW